MCKLVEDPKELLPLMPRLKPLMEKVKDSMSDPEARAMAEKAYATLIKSAGDETMAAKVDLATVEKLVVELVKSDDTATISYAAGLAASLTDARKLEANDWATNLGKIFEE